MVYFGNVMFRNRSQPYAILLVHKEDNTTHNFILIVSYDTFANIANKILFFVHISSKTISADEHSIKPNTFLRGFSRARI